jgi:phosphoserine phosphatase
LPKGSAAIATMGALNRLSRAEQDPLPSWKDGPSKKAILNFVHATTDHLSSKFVPKGERIASFDQDGTLWVEHPIYSQVVFALHRVVTLAPKHPEWKTTEPFKSVLTDDNEAMAKFTLPDLAKIIFATQTGMYVESFQTTVKDWTAKAKDRRWKRPYSELTYQPMLELMHYLRDEGYKTYIVTGGGQDFVRVYADRVYRVPLENIIGSALDVHYTSNAAGDGILMRSPKLLLNHNFSGKPEDIYLFLWRHPKAAFGNSTGDQQMLEYAQAGGGAILTMMALHDDADREHAYGPANGLPETKAGTFTQPLCDEAKAEGWLVISMKNDWKRIFAFDN